LKIYYDKEADAAYIHLSKEKPDGVTEITDYLNIDTTSEGKIVGIELLEASKKISIDTLYNYEVDFPTETKKTSRFITKKNKVIV
jgi:uncharacterized protein YuzE